MRKERGKVFKNRKIDKRVAAETFISFGFHLRIALLRCPTLFMLIHIILQIR